MAAEKLSGRDKTLIFTTALLLRVGYVLAQYYFNPVTGGFVATDTPFYVEIAQHLLAGNGFAHEAGATAYVSPLFPVFLAGCLAIFGTNLLWTSLFQCLLSALMCVFIASTAAMMFGKRAGIIAGLAAAFYYELIFWTSGQILSEPLYAVLLAAAVYALVAASGTEKPSPLKFVLAGSLFGLAALVRPLALAVALGLGILMLVVSFFQDKGKITRAFLFVASCLLVMQPWGLRNYFVFDHYTLVSTEGGHVFWLGNNPEYDLYEHPDFAQFAGYTVMFKPPPELAEQMQGKTELESNQIYARTALRHVYDHPKAFFIRALDKTWNMWRPTFGGASTRNKFISYTLYPLLLFASLFGIFLAWRRSGQRASGIKIFLARLTEPTGLLCVFLLIHLLLHAAITGEIRFRVPLWTALIPFASLTFTRLLDLRKKSEPPA